MKDTPDNYQRFDELVEAVKSTLIRGLNSEHFEFKIEISPTQKDKLGIRIKAGESEQFIIRTGEFPTKS